MHVRARHQHDAQAEARSCERARGREGRGGDVTAGTAHGSGAAAAANDRAAMLVESLDCRFFQIVCSSLIHLEKQLSTNKLLSRK